jgi:hypothetical protein
MQALVPWLCVFIFLKLEDFLINKKPTYKELEQGVKELMKEAIDCGQIEKSLNR